MRITQDIGWDVILTGTEPSANPVERAESIPQLEIVKLMQCEEYYHIPPQHVHIVGEKSIRLLRDFCDRILGKVTNETNTASDNIHFPGTTSKLG